MARISVRNPETKLFERCLDGENEEQCLARLRGEELPVEPINEV